ncbi:MAG: XrtA system polysaccharide deacetylase [Nanoarchaeota archaeon]
MINGLSFDIEDWFQVENLKGVCPYHEWNKFESRVERNTDIILELLSRYQHKATFFILGWVAERKPGLVKRIAKEKHEIASHGYKHELVYRISPETFRDDLKLSKKILEEVTGTKIIGYRAPNFSITNDSLWALDILAELGFSYDSSIFPTSFHDRYGFDGIKENTISIFPNGLFEFPLTVWKVGKLNFPLGGGAYFRLLPYNVFRCLLKKINNSEKNFIFYLHPWELDEHQPRMRVNLKYRFRHYINLDKTQSKLKKLLDDFNFQPLKNFLK